MRGGGVAAREARGGAPSPALLPLALERPIRKPSTKASMPTAVKSGMGKGGLALLPIIRISVILPMSKTPVP